VADVLLWVIMMFIVTQVYGILKNRIAIAGIIASYVALVLVTYSGALANLFTGTPVGWADIHQITWIPIILYGLVFALVWLFAGVAALIQHKAKTAKHR
jgi:predicted membrane protein